MSNRNQEGFSLVELLVAILLVTAILSGALATQRDGIRLGTHGQSLTDDALAAGSLADLLRLYGPQLISLPMPLEIALSPVPGVADGFAALASDVFATTGTVAPWAVLVVACDGADGHTCRACLEPPEPRQDAVLPRPPVCSQPVLLR